MKILQTVIGRLRVVGIAEGISFLVILFVTMPLKYLYGMPEPNKFSGMLHGVLFIYYLVLVVQARYEYDWTFRKTALAMLASIVPFGPFWAEVKLFRPTAEQVTTSGE